MFRRVLAARYKALFLEASYITQHMQNADAQGIFPKDPTLKDFLRSGPACLATLRVIWQYAHTHSAEACSNCLEEYVLQGKDEGFTELCVRRACGLQMKTTENAPEVEEVQHLQARQHQDRAAQNVKDAAANEVRAVACQQANEILAWMVCAKKDWCTANQIRTVKGKNFWNNFSRGDTEAVLEALVSQTLFHKTNLTLTKLGLTDVFAPNICAARSLREVVDQHLHHAMVFPETYCRATMHAYMTKQTGRLANNILLRKAHQSRVSQTKKDRAKRSGPVQKEQRIVEADQENSLKGIEAHLDLEKAIFKEMQQHVLVHPGTSEVQAQCTYSYKHGLRSRRVVKGLGAQKFSKVLRNLVRKGTRDFDFHNSMFTLVVQLVDKLQVCFPETLKDISAWRCVATDRDKVCTDTLECNVTKGKSVLLQVACGSSLCSDDAWPQKATEFLQQLSNEGRFLRWLARSQCADVYEWVKEGARGFEKSSWPEATVFAYW